MGWGEPVFWVRSGPELLVLFQGLSLGNLPTRPSCSNPSANLNRHDNGKTKHLGLTYESLRLFKGCF